MVKECGLKQLSDCLVQKAIEMVSVGDFAKVSIAVDIVKSIGADDLSARREVVEGDIPPSPPKPLDPEILDLLIKASLGREERELSVEFLTNSRRPLAEVTEFWEKLDPNNFPSSRKVQMMASNGDFGAEKISGTWMLDTAKCFIRITGMER